MFNNIWLCIYLRPRNGLFDNGYEFKRDFTPFLKDFDIKPVLMSVKNPQSKNPVEKVHKVILNMLVIKDLDKKVFDYIDPWSRQAKLSVEEIFYLNSHQSLTGEFQPLQSSAK